MKKLTKDEMKVVKGGTGQKYIWYCIDFPGGPTGPPGTCSDTDPAVFCGEYSCTNTGVQCSIGKFCP